METSSVLVSFRSVALFISRCAARALTLLAIFVALAGTRASAQTTSGVTGVVTDPSGSVVASVSVNLANPNTGFSADTKTDNQGLYQFLLVPPGDSYVLTFTSSSFEKLVIDNVSLGIGVTETKNAKLQLGSVVQEIDVTTSGEGSINTEDASIGNVIQQNQVEQLPIQFRLDAGNLLALQPGVQFEGGSDQNGSVTGARADQQTMILDGLDVTDEAAGFAFSTIGHVPVDSIQEVRTIVGNADSSFGRASSAQVDMSTKAGSNAFHGSLREYNRNTDFAANGFFNNLTGVPRPTLIRNQFGGDLGGPIKKDKIFFFFNYEGLRVTRPSQTIQGVPVDAVRNGGINYINSNAGCTSAARLNTQPNCITTLTAAQVAAMDPCAGVNTCPSWGAGADQPLDALFNSRYPEPNLPSAGDGINTEGFLFNTPDNDHQNSFVGRLDYTITSRDKIFARGSWDRDAGDQTTRQFPEDPEAVVTNVNHNRSFVIGYTRSITNSLVNDIFAGLTRSVEFFPASFAPTSPYQFGFGYYTSFASPYAGFSSQGRSVGVPEVRDQLVWEKGHHSIEFGGDLRWIRDYSTLTESYVFPEIGLGPNFSALAGGLRPGDIYQTPTDLSAVNEWDGTFTAVLGSLSSSNANYNFDLQGNPLALGAPAIRHFASNEYEFYAQDTWHVFSDLTFTYGLRWVYHGVPYEQNGYESIGSLDEAQFFGPRVANAAAGVAGNSAAPIMSFDLAGPANHAPGYYEPDYKDFAPRIGLAYSPSFTSGWLGRLFGDRKTSIRAGAGVVYDRVLNTLEFELDQSNFLFSESQIPDTFGSNADPSGSLAADPRFTGINTAPAPSVSPIPHPYTPNVDANGNPIGLADFGGFPNFFNFDRHLKTPYAITVSLGVQRELPGNFFLEADYFGRFGHRLTAIGDAAQQLNFKDPASGQFLNTAFGDLQTQLQNGTPIGSVTAVPWFENQMPPAVALNYGGATCEDFGVANCTQLAAAAASTVIPVGDLSSTDFYLSEDGLLLPNTGLDAQTGSAGYIGNYSASSYNGLIIVLRKKLSNNLQFDFDYTFAHSIDNVSDINNNFIDYSYSGNGLVCDLRNLRVCRASSDFDARHTFVANYVYNLPIGHGQRFLGDAPKWLDELVGGWGTSGIVFWHSGFALNTSTNTFPIDFTLSAPAVYVGPSSDVKQNISTDVQTQSVQFFASPTNALNAFQYPFGGGTGNRNALRGPNFSNVDMGIFKYFTMPWSDAQRLQFRADAFNVFNNVSFGSPNTAINSPSTFGLITSQENSPRVLQVALRFEF